MRTGSRRQCRHQFQRRQEFIAHAARGNLAGPAGDERNAQAAFPQCALVSAQRCVATVAAAAVVGLKNDERVVFLLQFANQRQDFADGVVHAGDGGVVAFQIVGQFGIGVFGDVFFWRLNAGP